MKKCPVPLCPWEEDLQARIRELEAELHKKRIRLQEADEHIDGAEKEIKRLREALQAVIDEGHHDIDSRLRYVEVQMGRDTLEQVRKALGVSDE